MANKNTQSWFALVAVFGAILCFSSPAEGLGTVYDVDANKYVGRWYNMYTNFWTDSFTGIDGAECTTAEYGKVSETNFTVTNAYSVGEGEPVTSSGYAWVPIQSEPGKVLIELDNDAAASTYWILKLGPIVDDQYEYSVVTDSQARSLSVLARDPETFDINYDAEVTEYLLITGFTSPTTQRVRVYHGDDCTYLSPEA
ncbi:lazarillo protein-like [Strongylocentrotus purpuratus]|uniref:Lipocalin/cytosolic fatty-acid binding domain-containing protein n=1 Tax=Strongylocentrotus purpuratus TaxID=7668 RepID=A0A7M7NXW8_STRPU|nr:lazarillo protein-like [Strongylocentrotus purpuratus]